MQTTRIARLDWISRTVLEHFYAEQHAASSDLNGGHVEAKWSLDPDPQSASDPDPRSRVESPIVRNKGVLA